MQKLVHHVEQQSLNGFLGHQRQEDIEHQFPTPVTHWLGAAWKDDKAYFRGVVDKTAGDLKRWIRAGRVTQPSIFTYPTLTKGSNGETEVRDLSPLSIDWAPLGRAGMDTARVVYAGAEMLPNSTHPYIAWGEMDAGDAPTSSTPPTTPQGGTPAVPTYAELTTALVDGNHDKAKLAHDLGISPGDVLRGSSVAEFGTALGTDGRRTIVKGELAEYRRSHPRKAAGELAADPVEALVNQEDFRDTLAAKLGLATTASNEDLLAAIDKRDKALAALVGSAQEATADGVLAEMHLPEPVVPLVRERLVARLPSGAAVLADPKLAGAEAIREIAGEIVKEPSIKPLLEGFYAGGAQPPRSNGQAAGASGEVAPLKLQTDAGFAFERRAI